MATKKPKRPKMPKQTASVAVWERFHARLAEWQKKCKSIDQAKSRKLSLIKSAQAKIGKL